MPRNKNLPINNYFCRLREIRISKSKSGKWTMLLLWNILYSQSGGDWKPIDGKHTAIMRWGLEGEAWDKYTSKQLESAGFNGSFSEPKLDPTYYDPGVPLTLTYNTNGYDEWRFEWDKGGGVDYESPDSGVIAELDARWKSLTGGITETPAPADQPPPPPPGGTPCNPDDLPF